MMMKECLRKEYSCKYDLRGIVIYVYERDYSLMNNLVAKAFKELEQSEDQEWRNSLLIFFLCLKINQIRIYSFYVWWIDLTLITLNVYNRLGGYHDKKNNRENKRSKWKG